MVVGGTVLAIVLALVSGSDDAGEAAATPGAAATGGVAATVVEPPPAQPAPAKTPPAQPAPPETPPAQPAPPETPPARDASVVPPAQHDAGGAVPTAPQKRAPAAAPGTLFVDTEPWSRVRAGGRNLGTTPVIGAKLAPGTHLLSFVDSDGHRYNRRVTITSGQPTKAFFKLQ
jgi:hypothetical protein